MIVAGYGLAGRAICRALRSAGIPYVAVDMNPDNVRHATEAGDRVVLGDVTQHVVLEELGCNEARLVVIGINDTNATELVTRAIRKAAPGVTIVARAQYEMDRDALRRAGATEVVSAEAIAGEALVGAVLRALEIDRRVE